MIRQHDSPGTHADRARPSRNMCDDDGCRRTGDPNHVVMFGEPEATVSPLLGMSGQIQRIAQRVRRGGTFSDECEIENGEWNHLRILIVLVRTLSQIPSMFRLGRIAPVLIAPIRTVTCKTAAAPEISDQLHMHGSHSGPIEFG